MKSDLKPLSSDNILVKYADDIILLVPENSTVDTATALCHAQAWAVANKLGVNTKKTKEMVPRQPRARSHHMPPPLDDVGRVASAKFLGVIFQDNFKMDLHVNSILSQCNQRFYLLKLLRSQGMSAVQLEQIVQAIIVSRIRYALLAWSGFLTVELMNKLQSTLKRL